MPLPEWALQYKEPHTEIRRIRGRFYKYEISSRYSPEKKRSVKITVRILGSISEQDGFVPSEKNRLREAAEAVPPMDIKVFGTYALFSHFLKDEIASLADILGPSVAGPLLAFSMFRWAYQSPVKRAADYHAHDFCSEYFHPGARLSDKVVSTALKTAGERREKVVQWMQTLLSGMGHENFIFMDSTHCMSASERLGVNAKGYNRRSGFGKQIRLMYLFSAQMKKPVYYRLINGNIPDVTSMSLSVKEIGIRDAVFIADKGFYSAANIAAMDSQNLYYIIPLKRDNKMINYEGFEKNDFKKSRNYFMYQKRIIWYTEYETEGKKFYTYLDEQLRVREEHDYLRRVQSHPNRYSMEGYYEHLSRFGTLTLLWKTETPFTAEKAYVTYKQRNEIEMMFDSYKTFLEGDKLYMQDRYVLEGWLLANFIAMLAYYKLYDRLREAEMLDKYSPKDIVELSRTIFQVKIRGKWSRSEITLRLKKLFQKLKIDSLT
jgi:hypothetical protein